MKAKEMKEFNKVMSEHIKDLKKAVLESIDDFEREMQKDEVVTSSTPKIYKTYRIHSIFSTFINIALDYEKSLNEIDDPLGSFAPILACEGLKFVVNEMIVIVNEMHANVIKQKMELEMAKTASLKTEGIH